MVSETTGIVGTLCGLNDYKISAALVMVTDQN